jgi:two-component system C4-dicarboxylate transport sensor histidine kinase DctB
MLSVTYPQGYRVILPYFWPLAVVALAVATALSSLRLVLAPGFEFYLGPLFYLLAYRWFGFRLGIAAAICTMLPSVWWWGHPLGIVLAMGNVWAVHRFAGDERSLSSVTFFYQTIFATLVGLALAKLHYNIPVDLTLVRLLRRILCETLLAALADIIVLAVLIDPSKGTVRRARMVGLQPSLEAVVSIAVAGAATLFMLGELNHVNERLDLHQQDVASAVAALPTRERLQEGTVYGLKMHGVDPRLPLAIASLGRLRETAASLGCSRLDTGSGRAKDEGTFGYWLNMCYVVPHVKGQLAIVSSRRHVIDLYGDVLRGVMPLTAYLALAQIGLLMFGRQVGRSTKVLNQALRGFGRGYVTIRPTAPFREADELLESFIAANNEFVAFERQRVHLMHAVEELRSAVDLKLLSDIRFDAPSRELRYTRIDPALGRRNASLAVHAADAGHFDDLADQKELMVEFRRGQGPEDQWYLLLAREYDTESESWRFGCLIRLRTAKAFQTQMRHSARLMELGGMASALSHELRQPLFTISLAAENGTLMLDQNPPDTIRLKQKFQRIVEQVERANAIVQRTSAYARIERDERTPTDLGHSARNAVRFMRPLLAERTINLQVSIPPSIPMLTLPRIGVEQILVNALQNAADSIDARRDAQGPGTIGRIGVTVALAKDAVSLHIRDNGAGLDPQVAGHAFNAFCTTKPEGKGTGLGLFVCRQIMDEVGGSIALTDNAEDSGATLTLRFPITAED